MTNERNSIHVTEIERRIPMTPEEKIALNERNIRQAIADYGKYTYDDDVLRDVSDTFIRTVAKDNYYAKSELRALFRKSPAWNEELDAIVINGTRTHDPDYERAHGLAWEIVCLANVDSETLFNAVRFFSRPYAIEYRRQKYLEALNTLAPGAYVEGKKLTRVFRDLCKAIGVYDDAKGSSMPSSQTRSRASKSPTSCSFLSTPHIGSPCRTRSVIPAGQRSPRATRSTPRTISSTMAVPGMPETSTHLSASPWTTRTTPSP